MAFAGVITAFVGLAISQLSDDSAPYMQPTGIVIGCLGGAALVGSVTISYLANKQLPRLAFAMIFESTFTPEEIDAALNQIIFIGMSELALLASWGRADEINCSTRADGVHKEYVYDEGRKTVRVKNGVVTRVPSH